MIANLSSNPNFQKVVISTGNILNVNNKLGRKSNEELLDGLQLILASDGVESADSQVQLNELEGQVLRATQELNQKLTENERTDISIASKLFLNKKSNICIKQAVEALLSILNVKHVDNLVLAYHPNVASGGSSNNVNATPTTPTQSNDGGGSTIVWNSRSAEAVTQLKQLWSQLEQFAVQKQIKQLGIADLDIETLTELHASAKVPPTIAQINTANCCVVPPELHEFCGQNDIQLLTHADPELLLSDEEFVLPGYAVDWILRYQVHVRCRGVLTAKGYILAASKIDTA